MGPVSVRSPPPSCGSKIQVVAPKVAWPRQKERQVEWGALTIAADSCCKSLFTRCRVHSTADPMRAVFMPSFLPELHPSVHGGLQVLKVIYLIRAARAVGSGHGIGVRANIFIILTFRKRRGTGVRGIDTRKRVVHAVVYARRR